MPQGPNGENALQMSSDARYRLPRLRLARLKIRNLYNRRRLLADVLAVKQGLLV